MTKETQVYDLNFGAVKFSPDLRDTINWGRIMAGKQPFPDDVSIYNIGTECLPGVWDTDNAYVVVDGDPDKHYPIFIGREALTLGDFEKMTPSGKLIPFESAQQPRT